MRRFENYDIPSNLEGLVISPGGVASTSIMEHVQTFININDAGDRDGLKHRPKPSSRLDRDLPVLLVVGDSHQIVQSLERRGYLPHPAIRLGCWAYFIAPRRLRVERLCRAINRQKRTWSRRGESTLILEFDELWDRSSEIADLFGITNHGFLDDFPQRKQRFTG